MSSITYLLNVHEIVIHILVIVDILYTIVKFKCILFSNRQALLEGLLLVLFTF